LDLIRSKKQEAGGNYTFIYIYIYGRIILKRILKKYVRRFQIGFVWLRVTNGWLTIKVSFFLDIVHLLIFNKARRFGS